MVGTEGIRYPISCIAGLMVRLPDREVSFMEPVNPSPVYPTGVQTFEILSFRSAEDFREKASFLIEKWAIDRIHADTRLFPSLHFYRSLFALPKLNLSYRLDAQCHSQLRKDFR